MLCCLCSHWFRSYIQIVIKCNLFRYSLLHFPQLVVLLIVRIIAGGKNWTLSRYDVKEFLLIRRILTRDSRPFKQTLLFGWTTLPQCFHGKSESDECLHILKYKISMHIISFRHTGLAQVVEIFPGGKQRHVYYHAIVVDDLATREPGHQQPKFWPRHPIIFGFQLQCHNFDNPTPLGSILFHKRSVVYK